MSSCSPSSSERRPYETPAAAYRTGMRRTSISRSSGIIDTVSMFPRPNEESPDLGMSLTIAGRPVRRFAALWHVGTMEASKKGKTHNSQSQEGDGLSVSTCPDAWTRIAQLGGSPSWLLNKDSNAFVDAHRLTRTDRADVMHWGVDRGLVQPAKLWRAYTTNEMGGMQYSEHATRDEAVAEIDDPDDPRSVRSVRSWKATDVLAKQLGWSPASLMLPDIILSYHAEADGRFDGVVWNDAFAPEEYSAPRAVIARGRLPSWTVTPYSS